MARLAMRLGLTVAAVAIASALSTAALAQNRGSRPAPRSQREDDDKLPPSVPPPISTLSPTRGISGPRLLPGAVLCRSEADLRHRAEVNRSRLDGQADPGDPLSGCHLVRQESGVEVVSRLGLGMVQVKLKPSGELGWTDAIVR